MGPDHNRLPTGGVVSEVLGYAAFRRDRSGAADQVSDDLRLQILSGRLTRGTRLPSEKQLAAHYDVSSPTVREALRGLSAMNLIEVKHGSGAFVSAETEKMLASAMAAVVQLMQVDIVGILEVSEALYVKAVQLAANSATDADIAALRGAADRFHPRSEGAEFASALTDFLKGLVGISHNPLLISLSGFLIDAQIALAQDSARKSPSMWQRIAGRLIAERKAIVDALEDRDYDAAEAAVLTYLKRGRDLVQESLAVTT